MAHIPGQGRDNTIRRTARVLEIIQWITLRPHYWSRRALAEYYGVSERMVQKDLEIIRYRLGLSLQHEDGTYYFERLPQLSDVPRQLTQYFREPGAVPDTSATLAESIRDPSLPPPSSG